VPTAGGFAGRAHRQQVDLREGLHDNRAMAMRLLSFAIWALAALSAVFWLTRLLSRADAAPAHTVTVSATTAVAAADLSRLLGSTRVAAAGAPANEPPVDARYKLVGVVAPRSEAATGLALIAVGDKPARPVSLGGVVDGARHPVEAGQAVEEAGADRHREHGQVDADFGRELSGARSGRQDDRRGRDPIPDHFDPIERRMRLGAQHASTAEQVFYGTKRFGGGDREAGHSEFPMLPSGR